MKPTDLTKRSNEVTLAAGGVSSATITELLKGRAHEPTFRLIEIFGEPINTAVANPFGVIIEWTNAEGRSLTLVVSCPGSLRLCLFARDLVIKASNPAGYVAQRVCVNVSDAHTETRNFLSFALSGFGFGGIDSVIPPFAQRMHVHCDNPLALSSVLVDLNDMNAGTLMMRKWATELPPQGLPLGGCTQFIVYAPAAVNVYVTFELGV